MKGIVLKSTGNLYTVQSENDIYECFLKGKLRLSGIKSTNPIAVGDIVHFEKTEDNYGVIKKIEDRRNYLVRKATNLSKQSHIIASNVDLIFLVVTLREPRLSTFFIDRFLVAAESFRIPTQIIINKTDLYTRKEKEYIETLKNIYPSIGYEIIPCSTQKKEGIDKIRKELKNKTTLLAGYSGVGKSSLINSIDKNLNIEIGAISETHKTGKHKTTFSEMYYLENNNAYIIDTPGIRSFGFYKIEKAHLGHYFPEIRKRMRDCKFHNCKHINEPKCAIKSAVEKSEIDAQRYEHYVMMIEEDQDETYRSDKYNEDNFYKK